MSLIDVDLDTIIANYGHYDEHRCQTVFFIWFKKEILKKTVENLFLTKDLILQRDYKTRQRNQDVLLVLSA